MSGFVQLVRRQAEQLRVERGVEPTFDFHLQEHEQIVNVDAYWMRDFPDRKTVDHHITVWVAVRL